MTIFYSRAHAFLSMSVIYDGHDNDYLLPSVPFIFQSGWSIFMYIRVHACMRKILFKHIAGVTKSMQSPNPQSGSTQREHFLR